MKHLIPILLSSILIFAATGCYTQLEVSDYSNQTKETLHNQNCQYERIYVQTEFGLVKRYQKVCRNRTLPYRSYYHNHHHRYQRPLKEKKEEKEHRPRGSTIGRSPSKENDRNRGEGRSRKDSSEQR